MLIYFFFNILVSIALVGYTDQIQIGAVFLLLWAIIVCNLRRCRVSNISCNIFTLFYAIYGAYLLLSQWLVVDSIPPYGYFVHSDAYGSFYLPTVDLIKETTWANLLKNTLLNSYFGNYPLAETWFTAWGLIAKQLDVDASNLRIFLRLQNLIFSSGILAIIAQYLFELHIKKVKIFQYCCVFGFCSYLLLTSSVFSRDLHVAFFYTLIAYYTLSPNRHPIVYIKLILLIIITFGLRPQNGMFTCLFLIFYILRNKKMGRKTIVFLALFAALIIISGFLDVAISTGEFLQSRSDEVNQGGLYSIFAHLPFPFNSIFFMVYSFIAPIPFIFYLLNEHCGFLTLTSVVMPFLNGLMAVVVIFYVRKNPQNRAYVRMAALILLYIVMCTNIEANTRRTFAVYPLLYMLFVPAYIKLSRTTKNKFLIGVIAILLPLNIVASIYVLTK